jgi:hypothetical protein
VKDSGLLTLGPAWFQENHSPSKLLHSKNKISFPPFLPSFLPSLFYFILFLTLGSFIINQNLWIFLHLPGCVVRASQSFPMKLILLTGVKDRVMVWLRFIPQAVMCWRTGSPVWWYWKVVGPLRVEAWRKVIRSFGDCPRWDDAKSQEWVNC